jgi:hypothetical protein
MECEVKMPSREKVGPSLTLLLHHVYNNTNLSFRNIYTQPYLGNLEALKDLRHVPILETSVPKAQARSRILSCQARWPETAQTSVESDAPVVLDMALFKTIEGAATAHLLTYYLLRSIFL